MARQAASMKKPRTRYSQDNKARPWRSVKYECVYLKTFESGAHLRRDLTRYFAWYSKERRHQGVDDAIPDEVYFPQPLTQAA